MCDPENILKLTYCFSQLYVTLIAIGVLSLALLRHASNVVAARNLLAHKVAFGTPSNSKFPLHFLILRIILSQLGLVTSKIRMILQEAFAAILDLTHGTGTILSVFPYNKLGRAFLIEAVYHHFMFL